MLRAMTVHKDRQTCHDLFWSPEIDYMVSTILSFWFVLKPGDSICGSVGGAGSEQWLECEFKPNDRMFLTFLCFKLAPSSFVSGEPIRAFYTIREGLEFFSGPRKIQVFNKTLSLFFLFPINSIGDNILNTFSLINMSLLSSSHQ